MMELPLEEKNSFWLVQVREELMERALAYLINKLEIKMVLLMVP